MPALKIVDLARVLIDEGADKHKIDPKSIELKITGPRPGEKLHEALLTAEEGAGACEEQEMFVLRHPLPTESEGEDQNRNRYDSRYAEFLDPRQIKDLLESIGE